MLFYEHEVSFAVDNGELLAGKCDNKTCKLIENWIARHRDDLNELWDIVKQGKDRTTAVNVIRLDKNFEECGLSYFVGLRSSL